MNSIEVNLRSKNNRDNIISTTKSNKNGFYEFKNVLPGDYEITANHPSFTFSKVSKYIRFFFFFFFIFINFFFFFFFKN